MATRGEPLLANISALESRTSYVLGSKNPLALRDNPKSRAIHAFGTSRKTPSLVLGQRAFSQIPRQAAATLIATCLAQSMLSAPVMSETVVAATLTLVEPGAFIEDAFYDSACVGSSVVVQQPCESSDRLFRRLWKSSHELRKAGCLITSATFLLGADEGLRMESRVAAARGLLALMSDDHGTLHLATKTGPSQQERLFELVERLLSDGVKQHRLRLTFREQAPVSGVFNARPRTPESPVLTRLNLTG